MRDRAILGCIFARGGLLFEDGLRLLPRNNKSGRPSFNIHLNFGVPWGACRCLVVVDSHGDVGFPAVPRGFPWGAFERIFGELLGICLLRGSMTLVDLCR